MTALSTPDLVAHLEHDLALLRAQEISVDVLLGCEIGHVPPALRRRAEAFAGQLLARHWSAARRVQEFGAALIPPRLPRDALVVAYVTTAALLGALGPDGVPTARPSLYREVEERLDAFLARHGVGALLRPFWAYRYFEHARAIEFYHPMAEDDFVSGRLHLPAYPEFCAEDLLWGAANGRLETQIRDGRVCIAFTPTGAERWAELKEAWRAAGVYEERESRRQRLNWFRQGTLYASLADRIAPDHHAMRRRFFDLVQIWPGAVVVDVGSGYGPGLLEPGGVVERVGPRGLVIALDPQEHLLRRLAEEARRRGVRNLRVEIGLGERMPLPSAGADIVITQASLAFMRMEGFFAEAWRVLRPGGTLGLWYPVVGYGQRSAYFRSAMAIVAALAGPGSRVGPLLSDPLEVRRALDAAGFRLLRECITEALHTFARPQDLPLFLLQTVRYLQRDLAHLPWQAEQERVQQLYAELTALGERVPASERFADLTLCSMVAEKPSPVRLRPHREQAEAIAVGERVRVLLHQDVVLCDGVPLPVPPAAARVLRALAQSPGPVPADALLARLGGMSRQTLYNAVAALRRELPASTRILLRRRVGYMLVVDSIDAK